MSETLTDIRRSKDGRPYIHVPETGKDALYTRASTFAKTLSDGGALTAWKMRMAYLGLNPKMLGATERSEIDTVIAMAMDEAGANDRAHWGTALHGLTDWVDTGEDVDWTTMNVPSDLMAGLDRYVEVTKDLTPLLSEQFVVNDAVKAAGTFDRVFSVPSYLVPGKGPAGFTKVLSDLKTGSTLRMLEHAIQLAVYSRSQHYDVSSGARLGPVDCDQEIGLIVHVPADPAEGDPALVWVDLAAGWEMSLLAKQVRAARSRKFKVPAPSWSGAVPEEAE